MKRRLVCHIMHSRRVRGVSLFFIILNVPLANGKKANFIRKKFSLLNGGGRVRMNARLNGRKGKYTPPPPIMKIYR